MRTIIIITYFLNMYFVVKFSQKKSNDLISRNNEKLAFDGKKKSSIAYFIIV